MDSDTLLRPSDAFFDRAAATRKPKDRPRSTTRKPKSSYKKLLWFKQPCQPLHTITKLHTNTPPVPDNYTDENTFLDHLQRNPRLQPYEFWSLMADATVIVQHLASVAIFCCCFVAIITGRVSPVAVVSWASLCTILGWALWDYWMGQEEVASSSDGAAPIVKSTTEPVSTTTKKTTARSEQRVATVKSAVLIYAAVLGLSPILKSLTRSTTSDSIWALSTALLFMNVAFFDYSGGSGAQYGSSVSWDVGCLLIELQTTCFYIDELCNDGFGRARFATAVYYACLLSDSLLYRDLRSLPHFSPTVACPVAVGSPRPHHHSRRLSLGWRLRHIDWQRARRVPSGRHLGRYLDGALHGHMQLVVDWAPEVQKRDSRSLGSSETYHPATLGLRPFSWGFVTCESRLS